MSAVGHSVRKWDWQGWLAACLRLSGWIAVNALCAMGCIALVFFAIGSFSIAGTMLQLANLATRYVSADPGRRGEFNTIVIVGLALFFVATAFFRRASGARALEEIKG
jgi:hypothetical protein